ncbi:hypothetical protein Tco_0703565 [Tanacetum coccineum]|uniref:G-protein coupled receptors family 2 profile 2 domain-containing protein n=1 Tax=Tanacetum coccineum TaxID=301880 RepID=A0ABQ4XZ92_9ASTR
MYWQFCPDLICKEIILQVLIWKAADIIYGKLYEHRLRLYITLMIVGPWSLSTIGLIGILVPETESSCLLTSSEPCTDHPAHSSLFVVFVWSSSPNLFKLALVASKFIGAKDPYHPVD